MKQLKGQEDGLNGLTIQDYFNNKALFDEFGRDKSINAIIKEIRGKSLNDKIAELLDKGFDLATAEQQAKDWLKTQAVLHNPDQVAGGFADLLSGLGDKNINSSIGSQWRWNRADSLFEQIYKQAQNIPKENWGEVYLNVILSVAE